MILHALAHETRSSVPEEKYVHYRLRVANRRLESAFVELQRERMEKSATSKPTILRSYVNERTGGYPSPTCVFFLRLLFTSSYSLSCPARPITQEGVERLSSIVAHLVRVTPTFRMQKNTEEN